MSDPGPVSEARSRVRPPGELGGRLGGLSLRRQVLTLAMWPLLEQLMGFLVSSVDLVMAARIEGASRIAMMDALGLSAYVAWLMMILQGAVGVGVMALVSRAAGARDQEVATRALGQGLLVGGLTGLCVGVILRLLLGSMISLYSLEPVAAGYAMDYLSILVWMCPVVGVMLAATYALRAIGDTRTPFFAMVVVNAVNVGLSWLFVFGPEPFGGMGVRGLALGTVLAWGVGMMVVLGFLYLNKRKIADGVELNLRGFRLRLEQEMVRRILRVGLPQGLEMLGMWAINSVTLGFIAGLKPDGSLGAHWIAIRVESMSFLPGLAIGTAGAALTGQYLGAQNPEMATRAVRVCWRYAVVLMSMMGVVFWLFPEELVGLIVPKDSADAVLLIGLAAPLVLLCGVFQPMLATCMVLKHSLRGAGATRVVMAWSFGSMLFYRGVMVPVAVTYWGAGLREIWMIMFADVVTQAVIFARLHFKGDWVRAEI